MYKIGEALDLINDYQAKILKAQALRQEILNSNYPKAQKDEEDKAAEQQIARFRRYQQEVLETLVRFPPFKLGYLESLNKFHEQYPFERSVFIMTKFPGNGATAEDKQLDRVIKAVRAAVDACGFKSHLASDRNWSPMLWDNVETYLMACGRGIAIVESRHTHELNPNVTMEWGWMRGTERRVLYLVEKTFDQSRADLSGLYRDEFDWNDPEPAIQAAVKKFLET